jgi:hypothetical protein
MSDFINKQDNQNNNNQPDDGKKLYFWIALGCCIAGAVLFGITFIFKNIYTIIASMILELAGVSFLNGQKRHCYFTFCKVLRVICYVIMLAGVALMLGFTAFKLS